MSEMIKNRRFRQEKLKELIQRLHDGEPMEVVREEFGRWFSSVSPQEITEMEQALVEDGLPVQEIQRLCDVHASIFKGSVEDIHAMDEHVDSGHPIHTFKRENELIGELIREEILPNLESFVTDMDRKAYEMLKLAWMKLQTLDRHYARKENLVFPIMERYGMIAPTQVMWGVDDEIRDGIRGVAAFLEEKPVPLESLEEMAYETIEKAQEMIFKEENILFPMIADAFTQSDWIAVEQASAEVGYTLIAHVPRWLPEDPESLSGEADRVGVDLDVRMDAGSLSPIEINAILNTVPFDMTFVGADDRVKYFTQGQERIFERPRTIIGRQVKYCHPPKSVHIVEEIVADLKSGKKSHEDFWIRLGDVFAHIRYYAVRDASGKYLGTLEVTQDIAPIRNLEGEKRLVKPVEKE